MLTVVTPATTRDLLDASELETLLGAVPENGAALIPAASAVAEQIVGRVLVEQTYLETLGPPKGRRLYLRVAPVTSVASVTVADDVLDPADYVLWSEDGALVREDGWSDALVAGGFLSREPYAGIQEETVEVQYTAGYTAGTGGTLPQDIRFAVAKLVEVLSSGALGAGVLESKRVGDVTEKYRVVSDLTEVAPDAAVILLAHRRGW